MFYGNDDDGDSSSLSDTSATSSDSGNEELQLPPELATGGTSACLTGTPKLACAQSFVAHSRLFCTTSLGIITSAWHFCDGGDSSPATLHNLLVELHAHRQQRDETVNLTSAETAPERYSELKTAAAQAREQYRRGFVLKRRINQSRMFYETLSPAEQQLVLDFDSGELLFNKRAANAAYGFGDGAEKRMSINEIISIAAFARAMRDGQPRGQQRLWNFSARR